MFEIISLGVNIALFIVLLINIFMHFQRADVGHFEKVSFEQYYEAMKQEFYEEFEKNFSGDDPELEFAAQVREQYDAIELPTRSTKSSAGYDFKSPVTFMIKPDHAIKIPTGIRAIMDYDVWLACLPRSGLGFKYGVRLLNTCGVIDADYADSDNEGHIFAKLTSDKTVTINAGDGFMQAIFLPYGRVTHDKVATKRNGGMGSTDK